MNLPKEFSDHPSLVGILRMPECNYSVTDITIPMVFKDSENKFMSVKYVVQTAIDILPVDKISGSYAVPKNKITDFYPYTYYVLTDNESDPLIMYPQYLPSSFTVKGKFALSMVHFRYLLIHNKCMDKNRLYCSLVLRNFHLFYLLVKYQ